MSDGPSDAVRDALAQLATDAVDPAAHVAAVTAGGRRRLRRRRQLTGLGALLLALVGSGTAVGVAVHTSPGRPGQLIAGQPAPTRSLTPSLATNVPPRTMSVGAEISSPIAVVDPTGVALIEGFRRTELSGSAGAESPSLSYDGRYLSWLLPSAAGVELHLVDLHVGDDPDDQEVVRDVTSYAWSPTADTLALCGDSSLRVQSPGQAPPVTRAGPCSSPTWDGDGLRLAVVGGLHTLVSTVGIDADGTVSRIGHPLELPYAAGIARFVGNGLLLWPDPSRSESIAADGLTLTDINLASLQAFPLGVTLPYPDWVQPLQQADEFLIVAGGDREAHDAKRPETYVVPPVATAADPPRPAAHEALAIRPQTSVLSLATSADGSVVAVTGTDSSGYGPNVVDGTLDVQGTSVSTPEPVAAVAPTTNGSVGGTLVVTADRVYLRDVSGTFDLGPIGPLTRDVSGNAVSPTYYSHVDTTTVLGQAATR